jgi:hypothetical protein
MATASRRRSGEKRKDKTKSNNRSSLRGGSQMLKTKFALGVFELGEAEGVADVFVEVDPEALGLG